MTNALLGALNNETNDFRGRKKSEVAQNNLSTDFNNFVRMLTTQLKYQDPSQPLESKDFIQQIVAFTGVEQAVATNKHLERLVELNENNNLTKMANLAGKEVSYNNSLAEIKIGSRAEFSYELEPFAGQEPKKAVIRVLNDQDLIIREIATTNVKAGINSILWDGLDNQGKKAPTGKYRIQVLAFDVENQPIVSRDNLVTGKVSEAIIAPGGVNFKIGEKFVNTNQIISLKDNSENITN